MRLAEFLEDAAGRGGAVADAARAIAGLAAAAESISDLIRRDGIGGDLGAETGGVNTDGDSQKALDVRAEEIIAGRLKGTGTAALLSEEQDDPVPIDTDGGVMVAVDPLDGSSNIGVNVTTGTIFSVLPAGETLQPGRNQLAAGFFTYGPQTALILAFAEGGCRCFVADPDGGGFVAMEGEVAIPEETGEYAINSAYANHWFTPVREWVEAAQAGEDGPHGRSYRMRWVGSLVADAWRIFRRGGVFLYPGDGRKGNADGRLRLVYEANPIAFLAERAGGSATNGAEAILDIEPGGLHQRVPLIFGSKVEVERLRELHGRHSG